MLGARLASFSLAGGVPFAKNWSRIERQKETRFGDREMVGDPKDNQLTNKKKNN
jgi:hypothetical protein